MFPSIEHRNRQAADQAPALRPARPTGRCYPRPRGTPGIQKGPPLNIDAEFGFARSIQGQLLRQSERREVAIFLRDGALWVADFIDGEGKLIEATTWFRFNCGALSSLQARRRMVLESAIPLSPELVARIGRLRDPTTIRERGAVGWLLEAIAAHQQRGRLAAMVARVLARRRTHRPDHAD